ADRGGELVEGHRRRRENPERARIGGCADEARTGNPTHAGLDDRHVDAKAIADPSVHSHAATTFGLRLALTDSALPSRRGRAGRSPRGSSATPRRTGGAFR